MKHYIKILSALCVICCAPYLTFAKNFDKYKKYSGKTITVIFPAHPHYDAAMKVLPKFTEETGIKVDVDRLEYMAMRKKQTLELTKAKGDYDLISYVVFSKADYVYANQLENLAQFFMNPRLVDTDYDAEDLVPKYVENIGMVGGKKGYLAGPTASLYGIPFGAETSILAYRKDIFEKHKLSPPANYKELIDLACKIKALEPNMGGVASRGASGHHISHAFLLHLAPIGGKIFDDEWNPIMNSKEGIEAANVLKQILECGPKGSHAFGFAEAKNAFLQGNAAMYLDNIAIAFEAEDPSKSKIVGKVAWAMHPAGVRRASQTGGFGIAIPKNAKNKEAAFLLMQWLTSKRVDKMIALAGGSPSRISTYRDKDVNKKYPYMALFGRALEYADPDWRPIIPTWGKINSYLGIELSKAMTGEISVKDALDNVALKTKVIMQEEGYISQ